jgi:hypothetical protein
MNTFLSDLWHDLREKRLWPVAVLLLAGLLAVPLVLAQPAEQPSAPKPLPNAAASEQRNDDGPDLGVEVAEVIPGEGSTLDVYDPKNPFRPPARVVRAGEDPSSASAGGPGGDASSGDSDSVGGGSASGGDLGGLDSGDAGPGDMGSDDPGSGDTGSGDTGSGDKGSGDDSDTTQTVKRYRYVVDVTFTANGRERRIKGLERLDMLPSDTAPLLMFLGVSADGGNAVFLVDSALSAAGEGRCKPSAASCAFLHIGPGSEHEFTQESGDSYTLRIEEIRKVLVNTAAGSSSNERRAAKGRTASASVGEPRRFLPPMLADLVSVSTETLSDSTADKARR